MNYTLSFQGAENRTNTLYSIPYSQESKDSSIKTLDSNSLLSILKTPNVPSLDIVDLSKKNLQKIDFDLGRLFFIYTKENPNKPLAVSDGQQIYCKKKNLERVKNGEDLFLKNKDGSFSSFTLLDLKVTAISSNEMRAVCALINEIAEDKLIGKKEQKPEAKVVVPDDIDLKKEIKTLKKIVISNRLVSDPSKKKTIRIAEKNLIKEELSEIEEKAVEDRKKERQEVDSIEKSREINGKETKRFNLLREIKSTDLTIKELKKLIFHFFYYFDEKK